MNKFLLTMGLAIAGASSAFGVYWLPNPVVVSEKEDKGKVEIEWTYDSDTEPASYFQVIVYKMHKAKEDESFTLAKTDFDYIESKGTFTKHEERGAIWDYVQDCPGWWVKFPVYMEKAMGIDTNFYYAGSDNSDIFGGAYILSPDYDLTNVSDKTFKVKTMLANEAESVSGGFAVWAWNTDWFDPTNIDYKPVLGLDFHYDDLSFYNWKSKEQDCIFPEAEDYEDPDVKDHINAIKMDRTRVMFYGVGYSTYWVNGFDVSVNLKKGESVDYGASYHKVEGNSFTIDTTGDTDDDYTYAYEVKAIREDYDDYRELNYIRFTNYPYSTPKHVIGKLAGVEDIVVSGSEATVRVENGSIVVSGTEGAEVSVYTLAGASIYSGAGDAVVDADKGVYVVKVGEKATKVMI